MATDEHPDLQALLADAELAGLFLNETRDHLATIEALALELERTPDDASLLDAIYRPFHTIKGNAYAVGLMEFGALAHQIEERLEVLRDHSARLGPADVDAVLQASDRLSTALTTLTRALHPEQATHEEDTEGSSAPVQEAQASIKVDTRRLDSLIDSVGELMILQSMLAERGTASLADPTDGTTLLHARFGRMLVELQRTALSLRMVPVARTFRRIARVVRDVSQACEKPVDLTISGESTELDRRVIEQIADPLLHLVRNAIDHGVEDTATRASLGKPARARLTLSASHQEGLVCIEITDDGRGLDVARIKATAVARGLVSETDTLSVNDIHQLIFTPGFSTAEKVTDISGRGVGMDVVHRNVELMGGRIDIRTVPGQGTTFSLKVPLTLAMLRGVIVGARHERFVLPAHMMRLAIPSGGCALREGPRGRPFVAVRGATMPFLDLATLMGVAGLPERSDRDMVLVIEMDGRTAAIRVEAVSGVQEFVVKPLPRSRARGFAGAAVLSDGTVGLVLDAAGVFDMIDRAQPLAA